MSSSLEKELLGQLVKLGERSEKIAVDIATIKVNLQEHMRRTAAAEARLTLIEAVFGKLKALAITTIIVLSVQVPQAADFLLKLLTKILGV